MLAVAELDFIIDTPTTSPSLKVAELKVAVSLEFAVFRSIPVTSSVYEAKVPVLFVFQNCTLQALPIAAVVCKAIFTSLPP
jgi:hypothetical protein